MFNQIEKIIESNTSRLLDYLPVDIGHRIREKLAIGGLHIGSINAAIVRHPTQDVYAVLINYGLIVYFVKFFSYILAAGEIDKVLWCSEGPVDQLSGDQIIRFTDRLADNFLATGVPSGPELLLEKALVDDITMFMNVAVQFVLCHEIGHFSQRGL